MTYSAFRTAILVCGGLLVALAASDAEAARRTTGSILCLPPGSTAGVPCGTAANGTTLLIGATPRDPSKSVTLFFREVTQSRKMRSTRVTIPPSARLPSGAYVLAMPRSLCAGLSGRRQFDVYQPLPGFNLRESIGVLTVAC